MALSAKMLGSAAYGRMCLENPSEFVPKSVFFTRDKDRESDRASGFWVKAALVYESITGLHVNEKTKQVADRLLQRLAERCCSLLQQKQEKSALPVKSEDTGGSADQKAQEITPWEKTTQLNEEQMIDGIFLVVGFLSRLKKEMGEGGKSYSRDAVDESFKSTHMQDIVTDVIKLENQIPLKHLLVVVNNVEKAVEQAVKDIAEVFKDANEFKGLLSNLQNKKYKLEFNCDTFHEVVHCFCWYYSPFFNTKTAAQQDSQFKKFVVDPQELTLLDCLHDSLVPTSPGGAEAGGKTFLMPTARELRRSGVRFDAGKDGRAVVEFNDRSSSLLLPALVYDFKLATVARNLLAWEYEAQSKPVTRYFQIMNELVVEVADVRILRRSGVVRGGSRGAHEVHELIKKIDGHATYPSVYMAMDLQIEKVKQFHDKRMKNFLVRYRPGVIWASSVAAVSVVAIIAARKKRAS